MQQTQAPREAATRSLPAHHGLTASGQGLITSGPAGNSVASDVSSPHF